jgi:hypothetical protein
VDLVFFLSPSIAFFSALAYSHTPPSRAGGYARAACGGARCGDKRVRRGFSSGRGLRPSFSMRLGSLIYAPPANHSLIKRVPKVCGGPSAASAVDYERDQTREGAGRAPVGPTRPRCFVSHERRTRETSAVSSIIRTCASDCPYMQESCNLWLQRLPTEWNANGV